MRSNEKEINMGCRREVVGLLLPFFGSTHEEYVGDVYPKDKRMVINNPLTKCHCKNDACILILYILLFP